MGYKIDYFKFIQFQADMEDLLGRMMEDLAALKDLETFMLYSQAVQCKSMACVNKYIQDKHLGIVVPAIETAVNNFMIVENAYFMEMYDIENKSGSIIEEEHLEELITTLTNLNTNITEFLKEMNDKAKAVKRIISLDTKSEEDFQDTMDALISMVSTLKTSFEEYEINKLVEANGSEWVVNGSTTAVDDVRYDDTEITEYQPEVNIEMEVPEFALRSSTFYSEFGYTEERVDNILQTKEIELELYAKAMEGQRLEQYFNNMLYAGVSMFLPFGNKIKGMKLILSEGLSLFSLTYSADRCYKGYQLLEQVELKDTETEATGLLNLENSKYGDAIIFMGEASNLYTSVAASNVVTCKIYGTPTTFASTLGDCGEEIVTSKAEDIVYNITGGNDIAATIIGGYIGNRVRRGVSLELEGIEDVIPSGKINNKTDFNNSNDFDTINSMQGYVVEDSDIDVVWREDVGEGDSDISFTWGLRGEDVTLRNVTIQDISYVKRSAIELQILRNEFNTTTRAAFLENLGKDVEYLKNVGFSENDILKIQNGKVPDGWQVHHKLPLDDSGTNSFDNLVLIQNEPYHKVITNYQNSVARQMEIGETKIVQWPMPNGNVYPAQD